MEVAARGRTESVDGLNQPSHPNVGKHHE